MTKFKMFRVKVNMIFILWELHSKILVGDKNLLRLDMIKRIHSSHIGVEGCLRRARESLY